MLNLSTNDRIPWLYFTISRQLITHLLQLVQFSNSYNLIFFRYLILILSFLSIIKLIETICF